MIVSGLYFIESVTSDNAVCCIAIPHLYCLLICDAIYDRVNDVTMSSERVSKLWKMLYFLYIGHCAVSRCLVFIEKRLARVVFSFALSAARLWLDLPDVLYCHCHL